MGIVGCIDGDIVGGIVGVWCVGIVGGNWTIRWM